MRVAPDCTDCDTFALAAVMLRRAPRRRYAFWLEMLLVLIAGWWLLWQVAFP